MMLFFKQEKERQIYKVKAAYQQAQSNAQYYYDVEKKKIEEDRIVRLTTFLDVVESGERT